MEYMKKGFEPFEFPRDEEITGEVIQEYIDKHTAALRRLKVLNDMYKGNAAIFERDNKALHKPDNRIDINFPKYITDTFCGFF